MKTLVVILSFFSFSLHSVKEGLLDPAIVERSFECLGWAHGVRERCDIPMELVAFEGEILLPAEVFKRITIPFQENGKFSAEHNRALRESLALAKRSFAKGEDKGLHDERPIVQGHPGFLTLQAMTLSSPLFNVLRAPQNRSEEILAQARELAEDTFWMYANGKERAVAAAGDINAEDLPPILAPFQQISSPDSLAYVMPFLRTILENYASYWEDILRRLNRYQLKAFDFEELKAKKAEITAALRGQLPPKIGPQHLVFFYTPGKGEGVLNRTHMQAWLGLAADKKQIALNYFEDLGKSHLENVTQLEKFFRKYEKSKLPPVVVAPEPKAPKPRNVKSKVSSTPVPKDSALEQREAAHAEQQRVVQERQAQAEAAIKAREAEIQGKIQEQMTQVRLEKAAEKQSRPAVEAGARAAPEAAAAEAAPLFRWPESAQDLGLLRGFMQMVPTNYEEISRVFQAMGLQVEETALGRKIICPSLGRFKNMHRPHHEGRTVHVPTQREIRKFLWDIGVDAFPATP